MSIKTIDGHAASIVDFVGNLATYPVTQMGEAIRKNTPAQPTPIEKTSILDDAKHIAKNIYSAFKTYHEWVVHNANQSSTEVYHGASSLTKRILSPIAYGELGQSAQRVISENFVGNLAQVCTFISLQFFHTVPYLIFTAFSSGVYFLYLTAPVALITFLATSILLIQIYLILELNKTAKIGIQSFEEQSEIINESLRSYEPIVSMANNAIETTKLIANITLKVAAVGAIAGTVYYIAKSVF